MAARKITAKITADRAEQLKKTNVRAGKSKANINQRRKENVGIKDGTVRLGARGKSYNVYDAKSGTWKRGQVVGENKKTKTPPKTFSGSSVPKRKTPVSDGKKQAPTVRYAGPNRSYSNIMKSSSRNMTNEQRLKGAAFLGGMAALPFAGAAGAAAGGARAALGSNVARGIAGLGPKVAPKVSKPTIPRPGTTQGVSKTTGGVLKGGKPVKYGPRKPTAAQSAQSKRMAAAAKAAATRARNAVAKKAAEGPKRSVAKKK